ncbi:lipoprotein NlpI [Veronia nyctiphanis]|uniref:Lipoprotein NlpI n=2 Tax=Veronia nyctiphanis TaxID=1278244 RepID=A0A4Q0YUH8_9GAMM|nr:lipoprotein NlpI [Veronia nyctiphanis]RXJ73814.1 lipoprotein NlpI [Veronia nyctiphanis]
MLKWGRVVAATSLMMLAGCASTGLDDKSSYSWSTLPVAMPLQPTYQQELQLVHIDQIMQQPNIEEGELARLHYQRGLLYDSIGLRDLAKLEFNRSLALNPSQSDVFNMLGVYFTQSSMFDSAYDAFESSLELDGEFDYAAQNLGIALYYGGRQELAREKLSRHFQRNTDDAYRALWLYLSERKLYGESDATASLRHRYEAANTEDWGWQIVRFYLGETTETAFLDNITATSKDNIQLAERLCEAYFYLAKHYQFSGDDENAAALYKLAMSGNVFQFVEHRYALLELSLLAQQYQPVEYR